MVSMETKCKYFLKTVVAEFICLALWRGAYIQLVGLIEIQTNAHEISRLWVCT